MRTAIIEINLYSLSELEENPKQTAIQDHADFLVPMEIENESGELERVDYNPTEADVIDHIEANEYLFYSNGQLANCTTFVGKHPRAGETVLKFNGKEYSI